MRTLIYPYNETKNSEDNMFGIYDINTSSNLTYKERLDIYNKVGFKEIALYLDCGYQSNDEKYLDIINYAKSIGLEINQVHIDWKISNLVCDNTTEQYFEYVSSKLIEANSLGIKYVVCHASQSDNPPIISDTQLAKFKNMMSSLENRTVILCIENVRNNTNLEKILELNLTNVKVCFDLGHAHCYDNEKELFKKYKEQIVCSHLHNNFGKDTHNTLTNGEIDYKYYTKQLSQMENTSNCLECFPPIHSNLSQKEFEDFVKECYNSLK